MVVTLTRLRALKRPYFLARAGEGKELVVEPFCWCGSALDPEYVCPECERHCRVTLIVCTAPEALSIAQELVEANVGFDKFEVATLGS